MKSLTNLTSLKSYLSEEIIRNPNKNFSWIKIYNRCKRSNRYSYIFWFRVCQYLYRKNSKILKSFARSKHRKICRKYNVEIMLGAEIGKGLLIVHACGIVISENVTIGENFIIRQNTTIGVDYKGDSPIAIGNNVSIGANSCIIGTGIKIGDNITIGAMSFVNKDIPSNSTYITSKSNIISHK